MPQITKTSRVLALAPLVFAGVLALAGCGDRNPQSNLDPDAGAHLAGWLPTGHSSEAISHIDNCTTCHGQDLSGGISKVACSQCHVVTGTVVPGKEPLGLAVHPQDWDSLVYARHKAFVGQNGTGFCASANCHGTDLTGGGGPSCSSCHLGGPQSVHPAGWNTPADITSGNPLHGQFVLSTGTTATCRNAVCHGPELQGVLLSGYACSSCHGGTTFPP